MRIRNLFALVLLLISTAAHADALDDILARNLAARGGVDKLRAIANLRLTGKAVLGGGDFSLEAAWGTVQTRTGKVRSELTLQGLTQVQAYDGKVGWSVRPWSPRRRASRRARTRRTQISTDH